MELEKFFMSIGWNTKPLKQGDKEIEDSQEKLRDGVEKTRKRTEQSNKRTAESFGAVRREVVNLAASFVGAGAVKNFVGSMIQTDAAVGRTAQTLSTAIPILSKWQQLVQRQGGTAGDADSTFGNLITTFNQARLNGVLGAEQTRALGRLGLTWGELNDPDAVLRKLTAEADTKKTFNEQQAFRTSLGDIGISGPMINVIMSGTKALDEQTAAIERNGTATQTSADAARDLTNAWQGLKDAATGFVRPELTEIFKSMASVFRGEGIATPTKDVGSALDAAAFGLFLGHPEQAAQGTHYLSKRISDWFSGKSNATADALHHFAPSDEARRAAAGLPHSGAYTSDELATLAGQLPGTRVSSRGRTTFHNLLVGGVSNSQHINDRGHPGTAIDLVAPGYTAQQIAAFFHSKGASVTVIEEGDHKHVQATRAALSRGIGAPVATHSPGASRAALVAAGVDPKYAAMIASGQRTSINAPGSVTIERIEINTQAKDAPGIARTIGPALKTALTRQANSGLR